MSGLKMKLGTLAMLAVVGGTVSMADADYLRYDFDVDGVAPENALSHSFAPVDPNVQRDHIPGNILTETTSGGIYDVYFNTGGAGGGHLVNTANVAIPTGAWQILWEGSVGTTQSDDLNSNAYFWQIGSTAQAIKLRMAYFNDGGVDKTKVYYNGDVHVIDDNNSHVIQLLSALNGLGQFIGMDLIVDGAYVATATNSFVGFTGSSGTGSTQWGHVGSWTDWDAQIDKVYYESGADLTVVPEPASLGLMGVGGLVAFGRRRKA